MPIRSGVAELADASFDKSGFCRVRLTYNIVHVGTVSDSSDAQVLQLVVWSSNAWRTISVPLSDVIEIEWNVPSPVDQPVSA